MAGETRPTFPKWKLWFWLAMAVIVLVAVYFWREEPQPLATLELEPLTGGGAAVTTPDLKGHVTLVNIWGTWCPPCREEFPHIVELYRHYRDRPRFSLLAVSTSGGDDDDVDALRAATLEFLDQQKASDLPTYVDPGKKTREAIGAIVGMVVYPTTVLVDAQGRVRGHWIGYRTGTEREMSLLIDHLLAE